MPDQPSWIHRVPQITQALEQYGSPFLDRSAVESIFHLSPRQANRLMSTVPGGYQVGRSLLLDRDSLLREVRRRERSGEVQRERIRREKVSTVLAGARAEAHRRSIPIPLRPTVWTQTFDDLPPGIVFEPGLLKIAFSHSTELLQKLFELAQAIANDQTRFEALTKQE